MPARADQTGPRNLLFVCGQDQTLPQPIPLTWGNVVLAGDGRMFMPCNLPLGTVQINHTADHREAREARLISDALGAMTTRAGARTTTTAGPVPLTGDLKWRAAQAFVRVGGGLGMILPPDKNTAQTACNPIVFLVRDHEGTKRWQPGRLFFMAMDPQSDVRMEAAYGIGMRLASATETNQPAVIEAATAELKACVNYEKEPQVEAVMLEAIGAARHPSPTLAQEAAEYLVVESRVEHRGRTLGAVKGLEALTRQNPKIEWSEAVKVRLRQLAVSGSRALKPAADDLDARIRRLAMMALRNARDYDIHTLRATLADSDWQVRRLVAMSLNLTDRDQVPLGDTLARDFEFQVRFELLAPLQRLATETRSCAPLAKFLKDPSPTVVMRAMDSLPATCTDLEEFLPILDDHAEKLNTGDSFRHWHLPSRALSALARLAPERAKTLLPSAVAHFVWQVRAAAAATSATLNDADVAETLAADREPNVRTAALDALFRLKSPALVPAAIDALKTQTDYQLLRAAALNLRGLPDDHKDAATEALLYALSRLTAEETDTSRDTRVAIIERLAFTMAPVRASDLLTYVSDYDDDVVRAAQASFEALVGTSPGDRSRRRRYFYQPTEAALYSLPMLARLEFEEGFATVAFRSDVAPVTVARVHELISLGYYNNKTLHRVVPNFVVQGGSPAMNEYAGVARFMRDEPGPQAAHIRGAIGISTRGRDTGDAQIFIDLVDVPRLDRDYTVFAYVIDGMDVIDRLLEGAVIRSFSIIK